MKMPWTPLHAQVHQTLRDRQLIPAHSKILIAVSGGQDSLCLAQLLLDLRSLWDWSLAIVHCDHRWRSDSAQNADHVRALAKAWDVNYHEVIAETDVSTEAKARDWRYQSFDTLAQTHGYSQVAIGHTATDRAETLLYNLARGSGAEGLQSLGWRRSAFHATDPQATNLLQIVRPLLDLRRSQTGAFCRDRQLPIWHDTTNDDITYRRNRIRKEIMPLLQEALNPQADRHLAQTAELLAADVTYLQAQAQVIYDQVVVCEGDVYQIHRHRLAAAPIALQRRVLRSFCQSALKFNPTFDQIEGLMLLLTAPPRSQSSTFKGGAIGVVLGDWMVWQASSKR
jgi:tRNA(Ile)-lysidine synthase